MDSSDGDIDDVSPPETQFVLQEGDEDILWKVIEITAEKGNTYRVRWEGIDPATKRPWPQSWVHKHDCTDDLVSDWKHAQARKKRDAEQKKGEHKFSNAV